jgi:hypothetical protein
MEDLAEVSALSRRAMLQPVSARLQSGVRFLRVVVAAVANKMARTIWAMLAKGESWKPTSWQAA